MSENYLGAIIFIIVGIVLKFLQIKKVEYNAYSTPYSRKSKQTWEVAQKVAPNVIFCVGIVLYICIFEMEVFIANSKDSTQLASIISWGVTLFAILINFAIVDIYTYIKCKKIK